ncbi:cation diffusion facilitator family transporter [Methylogaea oryzae]|uniref:cation diffusion facilitator family transporter n=1 Tax=Methylogaea oryzae TaxID=1295382 RepID=UPI0020D16FF8|nr:cation transporter dimerization domain-containing protein [Methylogaea oryzae]
MADGRIHPGPHHRPAGGDAHCLVRPDADLPVRPRIAGAALPAEDNAGILRVLEKYRLSDGVDFHDLRTRQSGAHRFVSLHLLVPGDLSVKAAHDLADRIEADIQAALPGAAVSTHIEPLDDPASYHPSGPMPTEPTQRPR